MFILQMAHVLRFFSWPWSVRLRGLPSFRSMWWAHSISMPPEPAVGSQMRIRSVGASSSTMSLTTMRGV